MSKVISLRIPDEVYDYFESIKKQKNFKTISDAFKDWIGLNIQDVAVNLKTSKRDLTWMGMILVARDLTHIVAEVLTKMSTPQPNFTPKPGYSYMLGYIKTIVSQYEVILDMFSRAEITMSMEDQEMLTDLANSISILFCMMEVNGLSEFKRFSKIIKERYNKELLK